MSNNIPSLLLTNKDVINPVVCLFNTAGQLLGGQGQEEGGAQGAQGEDEGQGNRANICNSEEDMQGVQHDHTSPETEKHRLNKTKRNSSRQGKERCSRHRAQQDENKHSMILDGAHLQRRRSECPPFTLTEDNLKKSKCEKNHEKKGHNVTFLDAQNVDGKSAKPIRRKSDTHCNIQKNYAEKQKEVKKCTSKESKKSPTLQKNKITDVTQNTLGISPHPRMSRRKSATPLYNPPSDTSSTETQYSKTNLTRRLSASSFNLVAGGDTGSILNAYLQKVVHPSN